MDETTTKTCGKEGHGDKDHGAAGHAHAPPNFGRAFAIGIGLNLAFVAIETFYGIYANSLALLADAGHNLSDVLGLAVAWAASILVRRAPSARFTFGLRGSSLLAALFNAVFLLLAVGAIAWEAMQRFSDPAPVAGKTVMLVAGVGVLINGVTAWLFASGRKDDINVRGAFLHMAADAMVSAGVVVAGLIILYTGWVWLDPTASLLIVAVIVWGTWGLLRDSVALSLSAVPKSIDPVAVRQYLNGLPGVAAIHDLHIWPMSTTHVALTCHLCMPGGHPGDAFLMQTAANLERRFKIEHSTFQVEVSVDTVCALAPDHVV